MAIDSESKRFSVMGMQACGQAPLLPPPSGAFDDGDRFHLLDLFSGFGGVTPTEVTGKMTRPAHWCTLPRTCT